MTIDELRLVPVSGDGLLARFPGVVLYSAEQSGAAVESLVELCANVAIAAGPPGRRMARRLAALLAASDEELPALCAVGQAEDGVAVLVHGSVDVTCRDSNGIEVELSGRDTASWLDRVVTPAITEARAGPTGAVPKSGAPSLDLGAGIVAAGGFVLGPGLRRAPEHDDETGTDPALVLGDALETEPAVEPPAPAPAPPPRRASVDFESVLLTGEAAEARDALPVAAEPASSLVHDDHRGDLVDGVHCSRNHFNDPDNLFCSICGISLVQQTKNVVQGPRPVLGYVLFDDGSTYNLDADYVVGRDPHHDPRVRSGEARPLVLDDAERTVSRIHAEIRLEGWQVGLVDRRSTNRTFLWGETRNDWDALEPEELIALRPGARVAFGRRTFTFESPHEHVSR